MKTARPMSGLPGQPTEAQFTAAVREYAILCGWLFYHTHDSRRSDPGFPDCVFVKPDKRIGIVEQNFSGPNRPRLIFAELKAEKGRVQTEQRKWLNALEDVAYESVERHNVEVYVWRPSDWPEIEKVLA
jgi:hypothetical protein